LALIYDSRFRALDSSGNPLAGATLTIFDAGTTNPTSIYRNAALSTPMSNPTTGADASDAGGWFPQIYAAEAAYVDMTLKDSGGSTIKAYTNVTFLGSDTGTFSRTFGGLTRFKLSDSGGVVLMEAGDPSPDNVGGTMTVQGWAGTQGDLATLNFATVNISGKATVGGKKLPGLVYEGTVSAQASAIIPLTNNPTGVTRWLIEIWGYTHAVAGGALVTLSFDGGGTYKGGASDYVTFREENDSSGGVSSTLTTSTTAQLSGSIIGEANRPMTAEFLVTTPDSGSVATSIRSTIQAILAGPTYRFCRGQVWTATGYGRATHLKLVSGGGGNLSLKYRITTQAGTGDT
jgi:hypothetical protein